MSDQDNNALTPRVSKADAKLAFEGAQKLDTERRTRAIMEQMTTIFGKVRELEIKRDTTIAMIAHYTAQIEALRNGDFNIDARDNIRFTNPELQARTLTNTDGSETFL